MLTCGVGYDTPWHKFLYLIFGTRSGIEHRALHYRLDVMRTSVYIQFLKLAFGHLFDPPYTAAGSG